MINLINFKEIEVFVKNAMINYVIDVSLAFSPCFQSGHKIQFMNKIEVSTAIQINAGQRF